MSQTEKNIKREMETEDVTSENQSTNSAEFSALPTPEEWALAQAQLKEAESKFLYLYADFENFKKRSIKDRSDLMKYGWEGPARDFLSVLDNLERAFEHSPENAATDTEVSAWAEGIRMVVQEFRNTLKKHGINDLDSVGKIFDPNFHEAVGTDNGDAPSGHVLREIQKGYTLNGRMLRPAKVIVKN